jgi:hypothetical protein
MTERNTPEPVDNVSIKSGDANRTTDGFGTGEGYSGDEYDSATIQLSTIAEPRRCIRRRR